jgi:oligosaccharide repeat unit polymerase
MGFMSHGLKTLEDYDLVAPFLCGLMASSVLGFSLAHIIFPSKSFINIYPFDKNYILWILNKYKWLLYVCFITGILSLVYLISIIGFDNIGDYRMMALFTKRGGIFSYIQWIGGHATIITTFYIALFGYSQALNGINIKMLVINVLMYGMNNIAIAGRGWITMAMVPYIIGYFFAIYRERKFTLSSIFDKNTKKLLIFGVILVAFFSVFGSVRNDSENSDVTKLDKLLYYTDGTGVTNIVMNMFPDGSFDLEYGACEFLSYWIPSKLQNSFNDAISDDIGLSVTVPSTMPSLYFDFGFWGGIVMWGIFCFLLEILVLSLLKKNNILALFLCVQITRMMFQAPIGPIFGMAIPTLEWLLIMYIFKAKLFNMSNKDKSNL